jgi:hypothetical protein
MVSAAGFCPAFSVLCAWPSCSFLLRLVCTAHRPFLSSPAYLLSFLFMAGCGSLWGTSVRSSGSVTPHTLAITHVSIVSHTHQEVACTWMQHLLHSFIVQIAGTQIGDGQSKQQSIGRKPGKYKRNPAHPNPRPKLEADSEPHSRLAAMAAAAETCRTRRSCRHKPRPAQRAAKPPPGDIASPPLPTSQLHYLHTSPAPSNQTDLLQIQPHGREHTQRVLARTSQQI